MESKIKNQSDKIIYLQTKILLMKAIIKNWDKATEQEKKEVERWWKQRYGDFEKKPK